MTKNINSRTGRSQPIEETESRIWSSQQSREMSEESMQFIVILRECVCVNDIEATKREKVVAFHKILPFTLNYFDIGLFIPTELFQVMQDIRVWFDNNMLGGRRGKRLEYGVDLRQVRLTSPHAT
jgi:hypothetical protein